MDLRQVLFHLTGQFYCALDVLVEHRYLSGKQDIPFFIFVLDWACFYYKSCQKPLHVLVKHPAL